MAHAIPDGMSTVIPHLVCKRANDAIAFYEKAFGAERIFVLPSPDGRLMFGCVRIGNAMVYLTDESPEMGANGPLTLGGTPVSLHHQVADVDASIDRAVAAGATLVMPAQDMFWGDRYGVVKDPFGHQWAMATHQVDMTPDQIIEASRRIVPGCAS